MAHIVEEGFRLRSAHDFTGYVCLQCQHFGTAVDAYGGCMSCGNQQGLQPVKSRERLHQETEAMKDNLRYKPLQREFNAQDAASQWGSPMTPDQLLLALRKMNSGVVMQESYNQYLGRKLMALYVRCEPSADDIYRSEFEQKSKLQFVCACEATIMPEWDIVPLDNDGYAQTQVRGWRSVMAIFHYGGHIPFLPASDGRRLSWHQISARPRKGATN